MTPGDKPKTDNTLKKLMRVAKALREPAPTPKDEGAGSGSLRDSARQAVRGLRSDPRVQNATGRLSELRHQAGATADERLARLIQEKRARQGERMPGEVSALLEQRRAERDAKLAQAQARADLLAQAETPEQRRVLTVIADSTPWAGGQQKAVRYTFLLDHLAPGGNAVTEMAVHRALWTLAERRVLAVSPHGLITAIQTIGAARHELADSE